MEMLVLPLTMTGEEASNERCVRRVYPPQSDNGLVFRGDTSRISLGNSHHCGLRFSPKSLRFVSCTLWMFVCFLWIFLSLAGVKAPSVDGSRDRSDVSVPVRFIFY